MDEVMKRAIWGLFGYRGFASSGLPIASRAESPLMSRL